MKKFLVFVVLLVAGITYVNSHYSVQDAVDMAHSKADPKWSPRVEYYAGYYLVMKDRNEEAIKILEGLLEAYPESEVAPEALFYLGTAHEGIREFGKAKELYEKYLEDNSKGKHAELARRKLEIMKSR